MLMRKNQNMLIWRWVEMFNVSKKISYLNESGMFKKWDKIGIFISFYHKIIKKKLFWSIYICTDVALLTIFFLLRTINSVWGRLCVRHKSVYFENIFESWQIHTHRVNFVYSGLRVNFVYSGILSMTEKFLHPDWFCLGWCL